MKCSFCCIITCAYLVSVSCIPYNFEDLEDWEVFKNFYGRKYETEVEENFRKKIFIENKLSIASHNELYFSGLSSYSLKMNEFGDKLPHEFSLLRNSFKGPSKINSFIQRNVASYIVPDDDLLLPKRIDWRQEGAVTPIKNQGDCGSCWAFSATGALEGQHFRKTGKLVSLSEQNLVDCSTSFGNYGCYGGYMENAYNYVKSNEGIDTEESYPYEARNDTCRYNPANSGADDTGYSKIESGNELALQKAVATVGPISVAIDATLIFQFYSDGVFIDSPLCKSSFRDLNHGVLVVGYDTDEHGVDYWIVKNSWGSGWGNAGYIYMARNHNNMCGIATDATFPLV